MIFLEPKRRYWEKGEVDDDPPPLHTARVLRRGTTAVLACYGPMVRTCLDAAAAAEDDGHDLEVIDLRTLSPLDLDPVFDAVRRTGRLVVVAEAPSSVSVAAEVAARVQEECFHSLESPVLRVTGLRHAVPAVAVRGRLPAGPGPGAGRGGPGGGLVTATREFRLPDVGEGLTEAEVVAWRVAPGDTVAVNDVLVEVETAKAAVELPSPFAGTVEALLVEPGRPVPVGTPIIAIETAGSGDAGAGPADATVAVGQPVPPQP